MITLDPVRGEAILTRSDGKEARLPVATPSAPTEMVAKIHTTPRFKSLLAVTKTGDEVLLELPAPDDIDRRGNRPVVYLDQNQWSTVANAIHEPGKVTGGERAAALQLAQWASQGRVILPAPAGHYHETTKRFDDDRRYRVGLTILQLGRGWQMRDPLQVRRDELRTSIVQWFDLPVRTPPEPVFSLDPDALYSPLRGPAAYQPHGGLPPALEFHLKAMVIATANISTLLDAERIEDGPTAGWAPMSQRFSNWLDGEQRDRQQKRATIDVFLVSDLSREIAEEAAAAGATPDQMSRWMRNGFGASISRMPATGLFREMLHERHLNKGTTWRPNDLTDMLYLSCAAGYADFVVSERHMRGPLAQGIKRLGRRGSVFRRLADVVGPLAEVLPPSLEGKIVGAPFGSGAGQA